MAICIEKLVKAWPEPGGRPRKIVDVAALVIEDGRQLCLVGHSGSGKTTLLNILAGIVRPDSGTVRYDQVDVTALSESRRDRFRAAHIGYVFQTFNLLQGLTAHENLTVAMGFAGLARDKARARADELLDRVGLSHRRQARPGQLSVGEQQRVAIARAVANRPSVVLADEPTANLDEVNAGAVLTLLREVSTETGNILVLVTHDRETRERFDDVVTLAELAS